MWVCCFTTWLALPKCEATTLGMFDLCHFDLLKRGGANSCVSGALRQLKRFLAIKQGPVLIAGPLQGYRSPYRPSVPLMGALLVVSLLVTVCGFNCIGLRGASKNISLGQTYLVATSSSIFYRIIRAGIGVLCPLGLTKVMSVSNFSDTTTPSLPPSP